MKKYIIVSAVLFLAASFMATAQDKKEKKDDDKVKSEKEIIIRKKDGNKATIVIDGDKVTINGKPADEWRDGDVEVYNYKGHPRIRIESAPRIKIPRGGLRVMEDEDDNRGKLGVSMKDNDKGAEITDVEENSAASRAGLKEGDVITKVGDKKVTDSESLIDAVKSYKAGEEVTVNFLRGGKEQSVKAKLDKRKSSFYFRRNLAPEIPDIDFDFDMGEGLRGLEKLKEIPWDNRDSHNFKWGNNRKLGIKIQDLEEGDGVKIVEVEKESIAEKAGLKTDDVLLEVSGDKIKDTNDAREAVYENWNEGILKLKIKRSGSPVDIEVKIPKKIKSAEL